MTNGKCSTQFVHDYKVISHVIAQEFKQRSIFVSYAKETVEFSEMQNPYSWEIK